MPGLKTWCWFLALAFLMPACGQEEWYGAETSRVDALVVNSREFALYDQAIEGFLGVFEGSTGILTMAGPGSHEDLLAEIYEASPRLVLAVGLRAAKWMRSQAPGIPTVFCMAMHPEDNLLKTDYMTGVHLEPSPGDQLSAFARILPDAAKIGVLYDPERTGRQVESIREAAADLGVQVLARPVSSREEVPAALSEVAADSQALWLLRDATVLTREYFNRTLMLQLFKRLPLITYSRQFVKKGAFFSYSASYQEQGREAGEIANRILSGASPADIPIQHPGGALYLNGEIGKRIGAVPPSLRDHLPPGEVCLME